MGAPRGGRRWDKRTKRQSKVLSGITNHCAGRKSVSQFLREGKVIIIIIIIIWLFKVETANEFQKGQIQRMLEKAGKMYHQKINTERRKDVSHNIHFLNLEPFVQLFQFRLHLTCYKHVTNTFPADNWQSIRFPLEKRSQHCFRPNLFSADFLIWKCSVGNQIIEKSESNVWLWATESATVSSVIRSESSLISLQISESVVHAYVGFQRYGANCFAAGWSDLRCIFSAARVCSGREGWREGR